MREKANYHCAITHLCDCFPIGQENLPLEEVEHQNKKPKEANVLLQYKKEIEFCSMCKCVGGRSARNRWKLENCINGGLPTWHHFYKMAVDKGLDLQNKKDLAKMHEIANFECASANIGGCTCKGSLPNNPKPQDL